MAQIEFSSVLPAHYRRRLEELLYFNRLQSRAAPAIVRLIEKYGVPRIEQADGQLHIAMAAAAGVQVLFALAVSEDTRRLAGVVIYTREGDNLVVIQLAVAPTFSYSGSQRDALVALRLVEAVRGVARRLNGVRGVALYYPAGVPQLLPVRPPSASGACDRRTPSSDVTSAVAP